MLENPGIAGGCLISDSLYAGLQLVLPGEIARTHRHSASALRFIIEGRGAYTSVEGERAYMRPGDFILTPSWTYHDHGNPSDEPIVWLDGLDVPIVNLLNTGFAEPYSQEIHPLVRRETDALRRYGSNMAPLEHRSVKPAAPLFAYPGVQPYRESLVPLERARHFRGSLMVSHISRVGNRFSTVQFLGPPAAKSFGIVARGSSDDRMSP